MNEGIRECLWKGWEDVLDVMKTALSVLYVICGKAADGGSYCKVKLYIFTSLRYIVSFLRASTPTLNAFEDCLHRIL